MPVYSNNRFLKNISNIIKMTGEISIPAKSGKIFFIGLNNGSVILYKKFPIMFIKLLCVFTIPKVMSQLKMACIISNQINSSITWLISITTEFIIE